MKAVLKGQPFLFLVYSFQLMKQLQEVDLLNQPRTNCIGDKKRILDTVNLNSVLLELFSNERRNKRRISFKNQKGKS